MSTVRLRVFKPLNNPGSNKGTHLKNKFPSRNCVERINFLAKVLDFTKIKVVSSSVL